MLAYSTTLELSVIKEEETSNTIKDNTERFCSPSLVIRPSEVAKSARCTGLKSNKKAELISPKEGAVNNLLFAFITTFFSIVRIKFL